MDSQWTLRAGYNRGTNPITGQDVFLNTLAPGVIREHFTMGASWSLAPNAELTLAAWHGRRNSVRGNIPAPTTIAMSQNGFGVQYSRKF
jgi:long-chain fatty acid transport protein